MTRSLAIALAGLALLGGATVATAAETIPLRDKKVVKGDIVEWLATGVRVRTKKNELKVVGFGAIAPKTLHTMLLARANAKDPKARLTVADTLQRYAAFDEARSELGAALKLDKTLQPEIDKRRRSLDDVQAQALYNRGLELMLERKWAESLDNFRTVADRFAETQWAKRAIAQSELAVAGLEKDEGAKGKSGKAKRAAKRRLTAKEKLALKKLRAIAGALRKADENIKRADEKNREGLKLEGQGKVSGARKAYTAAVQADTVAKNYLGKRRGVQRVATDLAVLEDAQKKIEQINKHMVLIYLNLSSLHMKERNFKRARVHVYAALKIDPMNKRALELKAEIAKHSIRRKLSDLTNARGRTTGGGR